MQATDPTLILVTTTATLPKPGEIPGFSRSGFADPEDIKIRYKPRPGEGIAETLGNVVALARHHDLPVDLTFNGTDVTAFPGETTEVVGDRWLTHREHDQKASAALPREGEGASEEMKRLRLQAKLAERCIELAELRKLYREMKEELSKRNAKIDEQHEDICARRKEAERLTAELAKRDETIAAQARTIKTLDASACELHQRIRDFTDVLARDKKLTSLRAELTDHEHVAADLRERLERQSWQAESDRESIAKLSGIVDGLRTQLARAGAIEGAARAVVDSRFPIRGDAAEVCGLKFEALERALAPLSPGPRVTPDTSPLSRLIHAADSAVADHCEGRGIGRVVEELREAAEGCRGAGPRGTPEGERLAKLERVAANVRAYFEVVVVGGAAYHSLRLALADLDAAEVTT